MANAIETAIMNGVNKALKEVHTMLPGVVQAFDPVEQTADIQLTIQRKFYRGLEDELVNLPLLVGVPVRFFNSGGFTITSAVNPGDHLMVIFAERNTDRWLINSGQQSAADPRRHALSDAYAVPWMYPQPEKITAFNNDAMEIRNSSGSVKLTVTDSGFEMLGDLEVTGEVTANGKALSTHVHAGSSMTGYQSTPIAGSTDAPT